MYGIYWLILVEMDKATLWVKFSDGNQFSECLVIEGCGQIHTGS